MLTDMTKVIPDGDAPSVLGPAPPSAFLGAFPPIAAIDKTLFFKIQWPGFLIFF